MRDSSTMVSLGVAAAVLCAGGVGCGDSRAGRRDAAVLDLGVDRAGEDGSVDAASADRPLADDGFASAEVERDLPADANVAFTETGRDGETAVDATADALPQEIPARQQVIFRVTNGSPAVRYLAVSGATLQGILCSPYAIRGPSGELTLVIPPQCGCECPPSPPSGITELWRLSPGETKDLIWDARAMVTFKEVRTCPWRNLPTTYAPVLHGVWQPVAPGSYQVTLIWKDGFPSRCQETKEEVFCPDGSAWGGSFNAPGGICDRTNAIQTSFDLPPEGDVVVPVTL